MAVTNTAVFAGVDFKTWSIQATADGDLGITFTHGFGAAPAEVSLRPMLAAFAAGNWIVSTVDASQIILAKISAGTSSNGSLPLLMVQARRPHTLGA